MKSHSFSSLPKASRLMGRIILAIVCLANSAPAVEKTFTYYRFTPTQLRGPFEWWETVLCQLGEFQFKNDGFALDVSGVTVTNPGGSFPAAESPDMLIDGDPNTKWLSGLNGNPIGALVFEFSSAATIDAYTFATANDAPQRDPVSWTLEGSDNGADWTLIDVVENHPTTDARLAGEIDFALKPTIVRFAQDAAILANGDFVVLDWEALNLDTASIAPAPGSVDPVAGSVQVTPPNSAETLYTLTGSATGDDDVQAGLTVRAVSQSPSTFRYLRFTPKALRDSPAVAGIIQISEFDFFRSGLEVVPASVSTERDGGSPPAEGVTNLIDGDEFNKWLSFDRLNPVIFDFGTPTEVDAYQFVTGNDAPERDPIRWYLEGSDDGLTWTLIDNVNTFDFPVNTERNRYAQAIDIPLPGSTPPVVLQFVGDAPVAVQGEPLTLSWEVLGAATVEIDNGVGVVASSGSLVIDPAAATTYTLTATNGSYVATESFAVSLVSPTNTEIAYADFDNAGDELALLGSAAIVNDYAAITSPGDAARLRLTADAADQKGTAWFRQRIDTSMGFDMHCALHMVSPSGNFGADGMSFMIQSRPEGIAAVPDKSENGLDSGCLTVSFDSYNNTVDGSENEPSAGFIEVRAGAASLAIANLPDLGIDLAGSNNTKFTDDLNLSDPYAVRIAYTPGEAGASGSLDVFFEGVRVIRSLAVDLVDAGAVNADGEAYFGFAARTGFYFQTHDVTSWTVEEGLPVLPAESIIVDRVERFEVAPQNGARGLLKS